MCMFFDKPRQPRIKERTAFKVMRFDGITYPNRFPIPRDKWVRATAPVLCKLKDYGFHVLTTAKSAHTYKDSLSYGYTLMVVKVKVKGRVFGTGFDTNYLGAKRFHGMRVEWIKLPADLTPVPDPR